MYIMLIYQFLIDAPEGCNRVNECEIPDVSVVSVLVECQTLD